MSFRNWDFFMSFMSSCSVNCPIIFFSYFSNSIQDFLAFFKSIYQIETLQISCPNLLFDNFVDGIMF